MKTGRIHICIQIFGDFRQTAMLFSVMHQAYKSEVTGITRYTTDGAIYIEAEGEKGNLERFKDWCLNMAKRFEDDKTEISYDKLSGYSEFNIID